MWSDWLVFCECGFHSFCPLRDKDKRSMDASWWERLLWKLGLVLMGGAMLSSVHLLSCVQFFVIPWTAARQASLYINNFQSLLKLMSIESVMPSNYPIICRPLLLPLICPSHQGLSKWVSSSLEVAKVLEFQLKHQSFQWTLRTDLPQDGVVGSPCSPRGSQESSPTPQFKSINSSMLSFLYSPTLMSIHDYWKNHRLD